MTETEHIIRSRRSIRAFTDQAVPRELLNELLQTAAYAPSGTNTQPWRVYVVSGNKRAEIVRTVTAAVNAARDNPEQAAQYSETFPYYPREWISPYIDRRRENGWSLYGLLGIGKGDKEKMHAQHLRNYCFFDAPVGLFFTSHRVMGDGAKMDIAMLMQNLMLAARARGLDTCAQAAWNAYHRLVLPLLGASADEVLIGAMALGYADGEHIVNTLHPPRAGTEDFTVWLD
ncbi:MAG: nitroreductase [Neisseria sp.]|nr:nitroreductase [Neisseria sp.]